MRKTAWLLAIMILWAVVMFAACQQTPDEAIVVQKDMEQMIEKGLADSGDDYSTPQPEGGLPFEELCAHFGVPDRYTANITDGKLTINCDVKIELPNTYSLPMARVESGGFSQEQVYKFWDALVGDTPMFLYPDQLDKEQCAQEILQLKAQLAAETDEEARAMIEMMIADAEKMYQSASDHSELVASDGTFLEKEMTEAGIDESLGTFQYVFATSAPYESDAISFRVYNDVENPAGIYSGIDEFGNTMVLAPSSAATLRYSRGNESYSHYWQGKVLSDVGRLLDTDDMPDGCTLALTPRQAKQTVDQLLSDVEAGDMMIDSAFLCTSNARELTEAGGYDGDYRGEGPGQQAYVFRLLRGLGGAKVESTHGWSQTSVEMAQGDEKMEVGKEWAYEYMIIAVDDEGISFLQWSAPLVVTEILTENTTMQSWSDIQSVFEKMIVIKNATYQNIERHKAVTIDVTRVSLSLQRIMERDSYTTGLLVPVWNFYGTSTFTDEEGNSIKFDSFYTPLISINAIDGSVIDVDSGY